MTHRVNRVALEVAVESAIGARTAHLAGADRVELCQALELGGLGPTAGQIESSLAQGIPVHVLIRPRPGNFVYEPGEVHSMAVDTADAVWRGASGVVIGALTPEGRLDLECIRRLSDAARDAGATEVTIHRAIDRTVDPVAALAGLAEIGVDRVLTSGGQLTVGQGLSTGSLHRMINASCPTTIMAGGGLALCDLPELLRIGVAAVHLSAARVLKPLDRGSAFGEEGHRVTDGDLVTSIRRGLGQ